ncbi:MAG: hypothetical protein GXX96_31040 [Planctomycetaceae bacterium]|nr:hypothetical protein [Planctomycetaceae bacterium]
MRNDARALEDALPALLNGKQACKLAGCGERTWWRWSHDGLAPGPVKIGDGPKSAVRYRRDEILQWILDGCPRVDGGTS